MADLFDISGRVCAITGGTSGIGKALGQGLAQAGAIVSVGSRDPHKIAQTLESLGNEAMGHPLDVADPQSVEAFIDATVRRFGRIDALITAAGTTRRVATMEMSLEDWDATIRTNLTGTFLAAQACGRVMREQNAGTIVTIASLTAIRSFADVAAYGASKAGVVALTQSLAVDWARYNIRVNAILPGVFPTQLNRALIEGTPRGRYLREATAMKRFGDPSELVGAARYLVSPASGFVTGTTLTVDGGFLPFGVGLA